MQAACMLQDGGPSSRACPLPCQGPMDTVKCSPYGVARVRKVCLPVVTQGLPLYNHCLQLISAVPSAGGSLSAVVFSVHVTMGFSWGETEKPSITLSHLWLESALLMQLCHTPARGRCPNEQSLILPVTK